MTDELRSLKASLIATPKWNKNSFAISNSSNNSSSNTLAQRATKDVSGVITAKAAPSGRPSLINTSFAFTQVPRSATVLNSTTTTTPTTNILSKNNSKKSNNNNNDDTLLVSVMK